MDDNSFEMIIKGNIIKIPFIKNKDDESCPFTIYFSKLSKRYSGLRLIQKDIVLIENYLSILKDINDKNDESNNIIKQSLWFSSIILYGKCFSDASHGRKLTLFKDKVFKSQNSDIINIHNELIDIRNQYIAHGGTYENNKSMVIINLSPDKSNKEIINIADSMQYIIQYSSEDIHKLYKLLEIIKYYLADQIIAIMILLKKEIYKQSIDDLYDIAKYPNKDSSNGI